MLGSRNEFRKQFGNSFREGKSRLERGVVSTLLGRDHLVPRAVLQKNWVFTSIENLRIPCSRDVAVDICTPIAPEFVLSRTIS